MPPDKTGALVAYWATEIGRVVAAFSVGARLNEAVAMRLVLLNAPLAKVAGLTSVTDVGLRSSGGVAAVHARAWSETVRAEFVAGTKRIWSLPESKRATSLEMAQFVQLVPPIASIARRRFCAGVAPTTL